MSRAVVYCRISQDRTGEQAGVARQKKDSEALTQQRGWDVTDVFIDNDLSAAGKTTRPGFERMLRAIDGGEVDIVIAWTLDRLTRKQTGHGPID